MKRYRISFPELEKAAADGAWGPAGVALKFGIQVSVSDDLALNTIINEMASESDITPEEMFGRIKIEEIPDVEG